MTTNRLALHADGQPVRSAAPMPASPAQDALEITINEAAPTVEERLLETARRLDRGENPPVPRALSMPWADLVWLLTGERLATLRQLRTDPARVSGTAQTATLEWAGLVTVDADGRPAVPYREIVVRIPL